MTLAGLKSLGAEWQATLRLLDWRIKFRWMSTLEEAGLGLGADGWCEWEDEYKRAKIVIRRKQDDIPGTIIHELLHVLLEGHRPQAEVMAKDRTQIEFAINHLTELVR